MSDLLRRLRYLLGRGRHDAELADELEFHREMASRQGRANVGNLLRLREESRDAWGWTWIDRLGQDLRYATRMLAKSPGFTLTAVAMLALGIGVNVAAFGFFNLIFLSALPVRDPDSLLSFQRRAPQAYASDLPYPVMDFYREHTRTLSAVLALHSTDLTLENSSKPAKAHFVTDNYFTELGGAAQMGRLLEAGTTAPVVVLSYGFWQRHLGGDPQAVGKTLRLNQHPVVVVGVAVPGFSGLNLNQVDVWLPIARQPEFVSGSELLTSYSGDANGVQMWGRLKPGLTPKAVEDEMSGLAAELRKRYPKEIWENETLASEPGGYVKLNGGGQRGTGTPVSGREKLFPILVLVSSLVLLILAVACGNLGSLLLARGVAREREIAIRVSVGAGSGRLVRQLFTESLLLAILGSTAGLALGAGVLRYLLIFTDAPEWLNPAPDWRVIGFALGMGFAAAMLFGLTPALQVARQQHRRTVARQVLIGAQVAASCILLIVAGLLVRALTHAVAMHPGFEYQQAVTIDTDLGRYGYSPGRAKVYLETLANRVREIPGVQSVSMVSSAPLGRRTSIIGMVVDGRRVDLHSNHVDGKYFETMKIPLLRGRVFEPEEKNAVIVSESFARFRWPNEDPLGKLIDPSNNRQRVVGIAGSARTGALKDPDAAELYSPIEAEEWPSLLLIARTSGRPEELLAPVAALAKSQDPLVFPALETMKESFRRKLEPAERSAAAISVLGLTALALACLGIVGLVTYAVSQRTKEIGIRMALGARPGDVLRSVLRQFSVPVIAGLLVGVGGAAALSQLLRRELYGISHLDPTAYLGAVGVFVVTATLAALWPARQALRVDPLGALRHE